GGALLLFIIGSALTFYCEMKFNGKTSNAKITNITPETNYSSIITASDQQNVVGRVTRFIMLNQDVIVLCWCLIILVKSIRLLSSLRTVQLLKRKHVFGAGEYWDGQLKQLAQKIGVQTPVKLLKSAVAKVPMVAGHFKPIILVPATMLTTLPASEIEAILLHELAHIRRRDYLVNLLQSFADIIFFFNPAVLWLSSLIRDERENCCDDIAIGEVKNKKQFIHALLSFQEYNLDSKYAATFPGRKKHLVERVKRIITNNNKTLTSMEKIFLASGILVTCLAIAGFSNQQLPHQKPNVIPFANKPLAAIVDTVPASQKTDTNTSKSTINTSMNGKQYKIVEENGKVTELYVDNVRIPDDKISQYKETIDKIHSDVKKQVESLKVQQKQLAVQAELMQQKEVLMKQQLEKQAEQMKTEEKELKKQAEIMQEKQLSMKQALERQVAVMELQQKQVMIQADTMNEKEKIMNKEALEKQQELMKLTQKELDHSQQMGEKQEQLKKQMEQQTEEMKIKSEQLMKQMEKMKEQQKSMEKKMLDSVEQFKSSLYRGKIKPVKANADDILLGLTNDPMIIKAVQQNTQVSEKLSIKYSKPNDQIIYNAVKAETQNAIKISAK
ncbi:MAG TPA: M56 family metallopeptidase, partial [Parafilimonas sp.]|nr:M56 family metallopeptidase [Parafilimonas sp.]